MIRIAKMVHMIDTETTSLSAKNGVMREFAVVTHQFDQEGGFLCLTQQLTRLPTLIGQWDKKTLEFTRKALSLGHRELATALLIYDPEDLDMVLAKRDVSQACIKDYIRQQLRLLTDKADHSWVFNHPEFDIPFLEQAGVDFRAEVGHSNVYDMRSLMIGAGYGKKQCYQIAEEARQTRPDQVAHTALGDCHLQMAQLIKADAIRKLIR